MERTKEIETDVGKILFRLPTIKDIWTIQQALPILPAPTNGQGAPAPAASVSRALAGLESADQLLMRCAKRPRLASDVISTAEVQDIEEISAEQRLALYDELLTAAGFSRKAVEETAPLSTTTGAS